ncbi:hypothetical protein Bca101_025857 [Brassica carinata]
MAEQLVSCDNLVELSLVNCVVAPGRGPACVLRECKSLEKLRLDMCIGVSDSDIKTLVEKAKHLRSISLRVPSDFTLPLLNSNVAVGLTDESLSDIAQHCSKLESFKIRRRFTANANELTIRHPALPRLPKLRFHDLNLSSSEKKPRFECSKQNKNANFTKIQSNIKVNHCTYAILEDDDDVKNSPHGVLASIIVFVPDVNCSQGRENLTGDGGGFE